jgi:uncharacterized repeat protein (TIGR03806 family)
VLRISKALSLLLCVPAIGAAQGQSPIENGFSDYGLDERPVADAYLRMPDDPNGRLPRLLSQTGAFSNTPNLTPEKTLIPYDVALAFWSDGARKSRWIAVPDAPIRFSPTGEWRFPRGTVLVKSFDLPVDERDPTVTRRLETRLLVVEDAGGVYGAVYKWRDDLSDAELLDGALTEDIRIRTASGETRTQTWYYPSREDCLKCHTAEAGGVLGVKTRQMNRELRYPSGVTDNQLRAFNHVGLFEPGFDESELSTFASLARPDDTSRSLEDRARSYLDANCSQCHRPGGATAYFDARYDTPLEQQGLIDGPVVIDEGIDRARVISPHDIWRSIAFMRVNSLGDIQMPPLARETIDAMGVAMLRNWIGSLPGRDVLAPPAISPTGGNYDAPITVSLEAGEPGAEIHYTLDGSAPGESDPLYEMPIELTGPTILRARSYKEGFTRSITAQDVFIVRD